MDNAELERKLREAESIMRDLAAEMNVKSRLCPCCNVWIRENMDDYTIHRIFEAAATRFASLQTKLSRGEWKGRGA
jgi:hypothetical protein